MTAREKIGLAALIAAGCFGISALLIGCDFSREESAALSTEEVLSALYGAQTETEALAAIASLEEKTGLNNDGTESLYRAYALTADQRAALAAELVAFNRAGRAGAESFADVFQRAVDGGMTVTENFRRTLGVFEEVVADALQDPEDPNAAFVLAAGVGGPKLPARRTIDDAMLDEVGRRPVSAIQAHFFTNWLGRHGKLMDVYSGREGHPPGKPVSECPSADPGTCPGKATKAQICHKPGTPAQKTLCVPLPAVPAHLRHGDTCGPCHDQGGGR